MQLPVGAHPILLVVNDGLANATNAVRVEVLTTAQAVQRLIAQAKSGWRRSQPLLASLSAALRSIERGSSVPAMNQLQAFVNKIRAQVPRLDPGLAGKLTKAAQEIISKVKELAGQIGAQSKADFPKLMPLAVKELKGKADGKSIKEAVEKVLGVS